MSLDLRNCDCMELMREYPDKYFDLAIVDPPYGIGASNGVGLHSRRKYQKKNKSWDDIKPSNEYFDELFRVSKNQIVCGANYFIDQLYSTKSFICWVKNNPAPNFAEAELLWTSFDINGKVYDNKRQIQYQISVEGGSMHPTQKPIALYNWILNNYSTPTDKILDTHLGSGSIAIACHYFGCDLTASEIDKEYYDAAMKRIELCTRQIKMF